MIFYLITLILNGLILWLLIPKWVKARNEKVSEYNKLRYKTYGTAEPYPVKVWEVALLIILAVFPLLNVLLTVGGAIVIAEPFFTRPVEDLIKKSSDKQDKS